MIDCDIHQAWRSISELRPYLDPYHRDLLDRGETSGLRGSLPPAHRPWLHPAGWSRTDATPSDGSPPGSDYELLCSQLLDAYGIDTAILTGESIIEVSTLAN